MTGVRVRQATVDDVAVLVEIHRRARDTYYRGVLPDGVLDDPAEHDEVWAAYERARAFYRRRGWRPDGHRRPGPADSCFLRLVLTIPPA